MKELKLLTEWADSIVNEFAKDGNLPLNQDPIRQTQIKYPHLNKDEAASKYLDDITSDFKDQNAVINAQSKKSEKLEKVVGDQNLTISKLNKEIDDIESNSNLQSTATNDKLKQIDNIKKISDEEHRRLVDKIDSLQNKPGMTDERYSELMKRVDEFQKNGVDPQKIKEFERRIESMSRQESVGKADFDRLQTMMSKVEQGQAEVERGRGDINAKIAAIEKRQSELEQKEKEHEEKVKSTSWRNDPDAQKFVKAVGKRSKTTKQRVDDLIGKKNERLDDFKNLPPRIDKIEPEVRVTRELALDASDEVDVLDNQLKKEQEVNTIQTQWIEQLQRNKMDKEESQRQSDRRSYYDKSSTQNPYANTDRDDTRNNTDSKTKPSDTPPKKSGLDWSELDNIAENILGPQYAKYLK